MTALPVVTAKQWLKRRVTVLDTFGQETKQAAHDVSIKAKSTQTERVPGLNGMKCAKGVSDG